MWDNNFGLGVLSFYISMGTGNRRIIEFTYVIFVTECFIYQYLIRLKRQQNILNENYKVFFSNVLYSRNMKNSRVWECVICPRLLCGKCGNQISEHYIRKRRVSCNFYSLFRYIHDTYAIPVHRVILDLQVIIVCIDLKFYRIIVCTIQK